MKIIFLDVDGVLNNATPQKMRGWVSWPTSDRLVCLKKIINKTEAKIVLHSHWRLAQESLRTITTFLGTAGLTIYDTTPEINRDKPAELRAYLKAHSDIDSYVILEDDTLPADLAEHQIQTIPGVGLKEEHIEKAVRILNG